MDLTHLLQQNHELDSNEELYILWWLEELKSAGYIATYERAQSFVLSNQVYTTKKKHSKRDKVKEVPAELLSRHHYTPDFKVTWTSKAVGVFVSLTLDCPLIGAESEMGITSYLEVKPPFDQNNMTRLFRINQKWVFYRYGIFINLVIPSKLFATTFVPERYLYTNKTNKLRKLEMSYRSLKDYVAGEKDT